LGAPTGAKRSSYGTRGAPRLLLIEASSELLEVAHRELLGDPRESYTSSKELLGAAHRELLLGRP